MQMLKNLRRPAAMQDGEVRVGFTKLGLFWLRRPAAMEKGGVNWGLDEVRGGGLVAGHGRPWPTMAGQGRQWLALFSSSRLW